MNFEEFVIEVLKMVKVKLGEDYEVKCKDVVKNNSCVFKSLFIMDKFVNEDTRITPAIYLENWYESYQKGDSIETIIDKLLKTYFDSVDYSKKLDMEDISRGNLENCIYYKLVNYEANKEQLKDVPFIPFLDLAVTFHYSCASTDKTVSSFRINDNLMKAWELTVDDLFEYSERNMHDMFPDVLTPMISIIQKIAGCGNEMPDYQDNIYVLTNCYGINGAATLLYTTKLHELSKHFDTDLYIIPSSIHELIVLPANNVFGGESLKMLVKEVNYSHVLPEERLSDNVYIFHKDANEIVIC